MSSPHALVPLDGSAEADRAVDVVAALRPSKITLLHVADGETLEGSYFDGVERRLKAAGAADVRRLRCTGDPSEVILREATKSGCALIALSMHGRSGWDILRLGTVAERVLRAATLPVLVMPGGASTSPADPLERVLAPMDGSELAEKALFRLTELFPAATSSLHILGVVEALGGPAKLGGDDVVSRFYQLQADDLKARLEQAAARVSPAPRVQIDLGSPALKILEHAAGLKASMIAMATHGRSGLTRWAIGSVTEQVLRASPVPILVLR